MGPGDQLGKPGRAARQEEEGDVGRVGRIGVGRRPGVGGVDRFVEEAAQVDDAVALVVGSVEQEDVLQRRRRLAGGGAEFAVVESAERVAGEVGHRLGVRGQVVDLVLPVGGQGEDRQGAEAQQAEDDRRELDDVGQLQHDPVAPGQAQAPQPGRHPVGGGVELGVGHAHATVLRGHPRPPGGHGGAIAAGFGPASQQVAEPLTPPVAGLAVALGELGGRRGRSPGSIMAPSRTPGAGRGGRPCGR